MRRPRFRFTIRSLMIAVALTGLVLAGVRLRMWQVECRRQAALHRARELQARATAEWAARMLSKGYASRAQMDYTRARAEHHARMRIYYEQAAARPWLSPPPKP